jgi:hypothetical protein
MHWSLGINIFIYILYSDSLCIQEFHKTWYYIAIHNFVNNEKKNLLVLHQNDKNNKQVIFET